MKAILISLFTLTFTALLPNMAMGQSNQVSLDIQEWEVPYEGPRSRDPWFVADDEIWFVGQRTDYVGKFDPQAETFDKIDLEPGAGPHTVIVNDRGAWYAGNRSAHIGHIDRETQEITQIELPGDGRRDVHTMAFDSNDNIWFTVQGGNQIGFYDVHNEEFTMYDVEAENARPYGIVVHEDQPWVALFGTNRIATVKNDEVREFELPRPESRPRRLTLTDGFLYYGDYAGGYLGRFNVANGNIEEWQLPAGDESRPYAVTGDEEGRVWVVETGVQPNRFVAFTPDTSSFSEAFEIESGAGSVRHMVYDADSNAIWFGTDENTIGRAVIN